MGNIAEFIYGDDYAQRNQAFADEMAALEEKHADFFKSRPSQIETEAHDHLRNHYNIRTASGQVSFRFNEGSDLPEAIRNECTQAFHRIWKYS
ncbi:MAG: hypothetical protein COW65_12805 [Cytophagales bacterium CG18_big_fil_WC_8_21_14_2_50_42_9]|nr:MAG: hypothetical protein COW65_12805 [Cytophagales bacterium CG18_big_fil_WC_8_21_14_2_50_42_9]